MEEPELPLRAAHRVFEPQLVGALGFSFAGVLMVMLGPAAGALPPEVGLVLATSSLVWLASRPLLPIVMPSAYRWLVVDRLRTAVYGGAVLAFLLVAISSALAMRGLPRCVDGSLARSEIVLGLLWSGFVLGEPLGFRRSLALHYLWPSSPFSYELRWCIKIVSPVVVLGLLLGGHRVLDAAAWSDGLKARQLLREIAALNDDAAVRKLLRDRSQQLTEDDQRSIATLAVEHARCDDDLLTRLVGVDRAALAEQVQVQRGLRKHAIAALLEGQAR